jgi:hypothetical protein
MSMTTGPTTWSNVISAVLSQMEASRYDGNVAWFRGERDATWKLRSTLHRHIEHLIDGLANPPSDAECVKLLRDEYKSSYRKFRGEAWPLLADRERSEWGTVFSMQHFSLPTRLLDWTESFACAVFFAQFNRSPGDAASIWVLDPSKLNKLACGREALLTLGGDSQGPKLLDTSHWLPGVVPPETPLSTVAVVPVYTNPRMVQQRSRFTLMGDSLLPLDEQWDGALVRNGHLRKIVLPPETFDEAEDFLNLAGVDAFSFFPDIQGLGLKHKARVVSDIRFARRHDPRLFK